MSILFVQSCNWIIRQSSHTLENPQHNSFTETLQTRLPESPDAPVPVPWHIPWFLQRQNWTHPHQIFTHLILLIRFFFHLPRLPSWSMFDSSHVSLKFDKLISSSDELEQCLAWFHSELSGLNTLLQWTWSNRSTNLVNLGSWLEVNFSIVI